MKSKLSLKIVFENGEKTETNLLAKQKITAAKFYAIWSSQYFIGKEYRG